MTFPGEPFLFAVGMALIASDIYYRERRGLPAPWIVPGTWVVSVTLPLYVFATDSGADRMAGLFLFLFVMALAYRMGTDPGPGPPDYYCESGGWRR